MIMQHIFRNKNTHNGLKRLARQNLPKEEECNQKTKNILDKNPAFGNYREKIKYLLIEFVFKPRLFRLQA
jgi:hypothetical protein